MNDQKERTAQRLDILRRFRGMYTGCHFGIDLFDPDEWLFADHAL